MNSPGAAPLTNQPSVTQWIAGLKTGDADAAQRLWDRYFQRLVGLACHRLGGIARGGADGEDVAQSVFKSLCLGAERGKFPLLTDRDNLWALLVPMTANKSADLVRRERSLKRGAGRVIDECALAGRGQSSNALDDLISQAPTPEFAAQVAEECERRLALLNDRERQTTVLKLQGFTNQEIADQMVCTVRTVERRLAAIRRIWTSCS